VNIAADVNAADLMTRPSADEAGHSNFVVCRDWRRELDQLVRREGDVLLQPVPGPAGTQATPNSPSTADAVTLIFTAKQDNGKAALIIGTPTKLFRFWGFEDNDIVESGILDPGITGTICDGTWLLIGSGFTTQNARRWEAKNVAGYTVFNNGIDLPVSYHLNEFAVKPLYELREQGVTFVGTIEEVAGILLLADIAQIHSDYLSTVMSAVGYGGFANGQEQFFDRVHYDIMWGDPVGPARWGAAVPGSIEAGKRTLVLDYEVASLEPGDAIRIIGAGVDGADLLTTLGYKSDVRTWIVLDLASTTASGQSVSKQDASALIVGHYPVLDDAGAVIRMIKLQDRLLIAKADGFVLSEYTGDRSLPFAFQRIYSGEEGVAWRGTLIELNGEALYAGKHEFYQFDLISRRPKQHPKLSLCSNIFFDAVAGAEQDDVFAVDNGTTREVWFIFPSGSSDKAMAYDYRPRALGGDRCTTIGAAYSAAAMVERPVELVSHGVPEKWFVLGIANGTLLRYLKDTTGPLGWQRRGANYNSDLWSGLADFGDEDREKIIKRYTLLLASQSPDTSVSVAFWAIDNANGDLAQLADSPFTLANPKTKNLQPLDYVEHLIQERLTVSGSANLRIRKRRWDVAPHGGDGTTRVV
jgi:hypothetical protein